MPSPSNDILDIGMVFNIGVTLRVKKERGMSILRHHDID